MKKLLPFLLLCANVVAQESNSPVPALAPDPRHIIDDELFEAESGKKTEALAKEGNLVNYTEIAKRVPATHPGIPVAPVAAKSLVPTELAEMLQRSTVALGLRYQEPKSKKWRFMIGATAFAVAPGVFSTSLHVMTVDPTLMREAQAVGETLGIRFRIPLEKRIAGAQAVGEHKTSMLQDVEAGRATEVDALVGSILELGAVAQVATPAIAAVYGCMRLLEDTRAKG